MKISKKFLSIILSLVVIGAVFGAHAITNAIDEPENGVNLTVGENIVSHYYIDAAYYRDRGCDEIRYTYNSTDEKEKYTRITETDSLGNDAKYVIDAVQAAAQLAEPTVIELLKDGEVYDEPISYSSKSYCDYIINMDEADYNTFKIQNGNQLKALCKAIVAYAKSAQGAFNYSADTVSGAVTITEDYANDLGLDSASYTPTYTVDNKGENISFKSVSFLCTSSAKMRFYLNIANTNSNTNYGEPEADIPDGAEITKGYIKEGNTPIYFLQVNNIQPVDFDSKLEISYGGSSISMSVLDYAGSVINSDKTADKEKTLAKSLIIYNEKAEAYFEAKAVTPNIRVKLPNTDDYLYRAGNANAISLGALFEAEDPEISIDSSAVSVSFDTKNGNAGGTFTANTSDWKAATVKFTNTGVIELSVSQGDIEVASLLLEVVAGTNVTGGNLSNITSNNTVLLGDVAVNKITMNNGKTLYANGFTVTDQMAATNNNTSGFINMSGGASIDNAKIIGYECTSQVTAGVTNKDYAPGIRIDGDANIFNSYVSGRKNAVEIHSGKVNIVNSTIDGGAISNVQVVSGNLTMENCVTTRTTRGTKTGLGIWLGSASSAKLTIKGTLKQYNLLTSNEIPSDYQSVVSGIYNDSNFAYTYNSKKYVNMGILCMDTSSSIEEALAKTMINDERSPEDISKYGYNVQGLSSLKGTLFTTTASNDAELVSIPEYQTAGQYYTQPTHSFDYTTKNYQANNGGNTYCYYSDATGIVNISFEQGSSKSWDPMILSASKNNSDLSYTVSMNGVDYTNKNITFTESGHYQVEYTYTDPYNYDKNGNAFEHTYKEYVDIYVTAVDVEEVTYPASFSYVGNYSNSAVIKTINNETYVMPDVSATSDYIASTTVKDSDNSNVTVYCPVVTVDPATSNGGAYSSGDAYFYAPAFSAINITDYNQSTGAAQYTYNSSSTTWPHAKSATAGPDTAVFGCPGVDGGLSYNGGNSPFRSDQSNNGVYSFKRVANAGGLVFSTNAISNNKTARNVTLKFHYTSNEGKTYYYYIKYVFPEFTHTSGGSCLAEGSLVAMADGTEKAIEDVKPGDDILTWSFWEGKYETKPVLIKYDHGVDDYEVVNLNFSDGTTQRVISAHGFFDMDINNTVYITAENAKEYVGHRFAKHSENGAEEIELVSYSVTNETVGSYSLVSANNITAVVNGMITVSNEIVDNLYEYFDIGDNLKYDEAKMEADIEQYGLYTYDDFRDYISEELYEAFNGQYYKVLVGKGNLTFDDILYMIEYYVNPYNK